MALPNHKGCWVHLVSPSRVNRAVARAQRVQNAPGAGPTAAAAPHDGQVVHTCPGTSRIESRAWSRAAPQVERRCVAGPTSLAAPRIIGSTGLVMKIRVATLIGVLAGLALTGCGNGTQMSGPGAMGDGGQGISRGSGYHHRTVTCSAPAGLPGHTVRVPTEALHDFVRSLRANDHNEAG
jgi:hypothetical protein